MLSTVRQAIRMPDTLRRRTLTRRTWDSLQGAVRAGPGAFFEEIARATSTEVTSTRGFDGTGHGTRVAPCLLGSQAPRRLPCSPGYVVSSAANTIPFDILSAASSAPTAEWPGPTWTRWASWEPATFFPCG